MWKKTSWGSYRESDHETATAENSAATPNSSGTPGSLLHGSKRQRRPSVRLGEIGEQPAASLTEKRRKSIYILSPSQTNYSRFGDSTLSLEKNETLQSIANNYKVAKGLKKSLHLNSNNNENVTNGEDDEAVKNSFKASDVNSPCWPELRLVSQGTPSQKSPNGFVKGYGKKGRNGNKKSGELKTNNKPEYLSTVVRSPNLTTNIPDSKVKCLEIKDTDNSDDENDVHTPEGFRDCDLDESDNHDDARDVSNSQDSRREDLPLSEFFKQHEPSTKASEEYLLEGGDHDFDRNKGNKAKPRGSDIRSRKLNRRSSEPSNNVVARSTSEGNRCIDDTKAKPMVDLDRTLVLTDPTREFGVHSHLSNGVQGWLQDIGLGKYAQHFEAHEVDPEVLPLLTFEDLKEMGITAVGSRRKIFHSIQQLAKCLLVKTDKTPVFGP